MPCRDITETIVVALGVDERLRSYSLRKQTCGAEVGSADLLGDWVAGMTTADILELDAEQLMARYRPADAAELLYLKHLAALQEALRVLTGACRGAPGDACTAVSIAADDDGLSFTGQIAVRADTGRIRACGGCGSCGSCGA